LILKDYFANNSKIYPLVYQKRNTLKAIIKHTKTFKALFILIGTNTDIKEVSINE